MVKQRLKLGSKMINNIATGSFRSRLYLEDVRYADEQIWYKVKGVPHPDAQHQVSQGESELVSIYTFPFEYPKINRFYSTKIRSIEDEQIPEIIRRLTYINGYMNQTSRKKMVEYIILFLTVYKDKIPVIKFEQLSPIVDSLLDYGESKYNELVMQNVVTFFSKYSRLSPNEKRGITLEVRNRISTKLHGELIHNAASMAIEVSRSYMQVTKPKVLEQTNSPKINNVRTLSRYMREDTLHMLEHANYGRPFKKDVIVAKFLKFLEDPYKTTTELAQNLNTSKSTIVKFRELRELDILEEPRESYV